MRKVLSILLCFGLMGCAGLPIVKATGKLQVVNLGTVTVLPFDGYRGDEFSDFISQELMLHGVSVMERSRVISLLMEKGINITDFVKGTVNYEKLSGIAGVKVLVIGSVSPITVYESGGPSGKVSAATLRFVSVNDGKILGVATYNANTELLMGSVLYPEAAEKLVASILEK